MCALATLLLISCKEPQPLPPRQISLHCILCPTDHYTIESGGSIEVPFRVEDPEALFNYAVTNAGCQVELRNGENPQQVPEHLTLTRVTTAESPGSYVATITDRGSGEIFNQVICIAIKLESGELVRSNGVTIVSDNYVGGIREIRLEQAKNGGLSEDILFSCDAESRTFSGHIKEYVAHRHFLLSIKTEDIDRLEINGEPYDQSKIYDLHEEITLTAYAGEHQSDYTLRLSCFTGLPVMCIDTPGQQGVWSKEEWVKGSTLRLDGMGRFDDIEGVQLSIRGRGNSTWGYEKKPYNIKFEEKQPLLGMPKHKRWCLLANYMDRTLLRNRVAYYLAEQTSLEWTPRTEFVELFLNGEHLGQYLVAEHIKVDKNRVNITEMEPEDTESEALTGGYMLELDFHYDNEWQWRTKRDIPFAVKYPEEEDLTPEQLAWIKQHIAQVEEVLYGANFTDPATGYNAYLDARSFIDYWLIYEICVNHELANPGSVYMTKDRNGKLTAGPVWDFDWGTFSYNASPQAQWGLFMTQAWWYGRLFQDEAFMSLASERWEELKPKFMTVFDFIAREREYIQHSWQRNFALWSISTDINGDEKLSFKSAVDRMEEITRERIEIIDRAL